MQPTREDSNDNRSDTQSIDPSLNQIIIQSHRMSVRSIKRHIKQDSPPTVIPFWFNDTNLTMPTWLYHVHPVSMDHFIHRHTNPDRATPFSAHNDIGLSALITQLRLYNQQLFVDITDPALLNQIIEEIEAISRRDFCCPADPVLIVMFVVRWWAMLSSQSKIDQTTRDYSIKASALITCMMRLCNGVNGPLRSHSTTMTELKKKLRVIDAITHHPSQISRTFGSYDEGLLSIAPLWSERAVMTMLTRDVIRIIVRDNIEMSTRKVGNVLKDLTNKQSISQSIDQSITQSTNRLDGRVLDQRDASDVTSLLNDGILANSQEYPEANQSDSDMRDDDSHFAVQFSVDQSSNQSDSRSDQSNNQSNNQSIDPSDGSSDDRNSMLASLDPNYVAPMDTDHVISTNENSVATSMSWLSSTYKSVKHTITRSQIRTVNQSIIQTIEQSSNQTIMQLNNQTANDVEPQLLSSYPLPLAHNHLTVVEMLVAMQHDATSVSLQHAAVAEQHVSYPSNEHGDPTEKLSSSQPAVQEINSSVDDTSHVTCDHGFIEANVSIMASTVEAPLPAPTSDQQSINPRSSRSGARRDLLDACRLTRDRIGFKRTSYLKMCDSIVTMCGEAAQMHLNKKQSNGE